MTSASNRMSLRELAMGVLIVARRELSAYFDSSIAYVHTIGFVVLANSIFMNEFFLTGTVDMTGFFERMPLLLSVFLPAVTMRLWAEEKKQRTIELLLTLPIVPFQAVLGKFLAAFALYTLLLLGSMPIVLMLGWLGHPDYGLILSGYLGLACLGALFLALGLFFSSLTSDQIVAFVASAFVCFLLVLSGNDRVVAVLDGLAPKLAAGTILSESVSVVPHFDAFVAGVLDLTAVVYFVGLSALFLWINALALEEKRT